MLEARDEAADFEQDNPIGRELAHDTEQDAPEALESPKGEDC